MISLLTCIDFVHTLKTVNTVNTDGGDMFLIRIQSKEPIYEQIQSQILRFIEAGVLSPGDRLPSVRQLASDNGINPNTVARAYAKLEENGYVYNLPKKGVYVAEISSGTEKKKTILHVLRPLKESGITKEEMLEAVSDLYQEEEHAEN
ncbi:MAG TPA: GntR family transcriptional regulator [Erysipelotrichaceae bacterium]|nr:GntR family transcriptional regulator [Erysipelotrichaceae bacterium]